MPCIVFLITVCESLLAVAVEVKNTPVHCRDIISNDISVTTLPVRSPVMIMGSSGVPSDSRVPRTISSALSWKHSVAPGSIVRVTSGATTRES